MGPATSVDLSGPADFQYFMDPACSTPAVVSLPLPTGTTQVTFYWRGTVVTPVPPGTVTASVAGWVPLPVDATVTPAARDHLVIFAGDAQSVAAGACSGAVMLESRDAFGNVSGVGPATAVDLTGPADFQYFTDPACSTPAVASLPLPTGTTAGDLLLEGNGGDAGASGDRDGVGGGLGAVARRRETSMPKVVVALPQTRTPRGWKSTSSGAPGSSALQAPSTRTAQIPLRRLVSRWGERMAFEGYVRSQRA